MAFAWKVLLPMSIINIVAVGIWYYMRPRPLAWVVTTAWVLGWFIFLSQFSASEKIVKRTYRYAS